MYVDSYINWDFGLSIVQFYNKILNFQWKQFSSKFSLKTKRYLDNFTKWQDDLFYGISECKWTGRESSEKYLIHIIILPEIFITDIDSIKKTYHIWWMNFVLVLIQTPEEKSEKVKKSEACWGIKYWGKFCLAVGWNFSFKNGCRHPLTYLVCS